MSWRSAPASGGGTGVVPRVRISSLEDGIFYIRDNPVKGRIFYIRDYLAKGGILYIRVLWVYD